MINSIQSGYQAQAVDPVQRERERADATENQHKPQGDKVTLSLKGKLVSSFFADMGVDYTPGKNVSLEEIEAGLEERREQLENDIFALFKQNNISTNPPVELISDENGKIRVKGDHPQKEEIEKLFEANPKLANDFKGVSAQTKFVEAAKLHEKFAEEYDKDPKAAEAKYRGLFDALKRKEFSMIFSGESEKQDTEN